MGWLATSVALFCLLGCEDDQAPATPQRPAVQLRVDAAPGDRHSIVEVSTIEREIELTEEQTLRHDVEIGKHIDVEVVQVDPDAVPVRYRKTFARFRQRASTVVGELPPDDDASVHPLEGHTVSYIWRDDHWEARVTDADVPEDALPGTSSSLVHPWLPEEEVRPGDTWRADSIPLGMPGLGNAIVGVELELARIERVEASDEGPAARVAHVDVRVVIEADADGAPHGELEGFFTFQLPGDGVPGRMRRIQLSGEIRSTTDQGHPQTVRIVVYRAHVTEV